MSYQDWKTLVFVTGNKARRQLLQFALALAMAMIVPIVASAYTLVMRDGRHKEIPATFIVTGTALTYEWAPGFNVTLSLSVIDITATEQINGEASGSFLRRAASTDFPTVFPTAVSSAARTHQARLSITNADLERARRTRLESEKAYEQRRRQLGLPSLAETRSREKEEAQETVEFVKQHKAREESKESYWRSRATEIRAEAAEVDAQIYYLQSRLAEFSSPSPFSGSSIPGYTTVIPYGGGWGGRGRTYGGQRSPYGYGRGAGGPIFGPYGSVYPYSFPTRPYQSYDSSYEQAKLTEQLNNLLVRREGLAVRWRLLENEAHRAGVYPGWLRP